MANDLTMDTTELAELKKEVATLKAQMAELKKFLFVQHTSGPQSRPYLSILCSSISLRHATSGGGDQARLCASEQGPYLSLLGNDKTARAVLEIKDNKPAFRLMNDGLQPALTATLDDTDRAYLVVYDHGKPRAALKAAETGGVVTVAHDDGFARASLDAYAEFGTVSVINADMNLVGMLTSESVNGGGGALLINSVTGKRAAMVASSPLSGFIAVHDTKGQIIATLPGPSSRPDPGQGEES
jgi:hypothetical protein